MKVKINGVWYTVGNITKTLVHDGVSFLVSLQVLEDIENHPVLSTIEEVDVSDLRDNDALDFFNWLVSQRVCSGNNKQFILNNVYRGGELRG